MNKILLSLFSFLITLSVESTGTQFPSVEPEQVDIFSQQNTTSFSPGSFSSWGRNTTDFDNFFQNDKVIVDTDVPLGKPMDFENFFSDTTQSQPSNINLESFFSGLGQSQSPAPTPPTSELDTSSSKSQWGDNAIDFDNFFQNDKVIVNTDVPLGKPMDFENFFSDTNQSQSSTKIFSGFSFDTEPSLPSTSAAVVQLSAYEKQVKVQKIQEETAEQLKNILIAEKIRNEDANEQLKADLKDLEKSIPAKENQASQVIEQDLADKIRLLNAETALKVTEIKLLKNTKSTEIAMQIEDRVLNKSSFVGKKLVKEMLENEPEIYYQFKERNRYAEAELEVSISKTKLYYRKQLEFLEKDIKRLRDSNKKIIETRASDLENQRLAEALVVEQIIKKKIQEVINRLYKSKLDAKIQSYVESTKQNIDNKEKMTLSKLKSDYVNEQDERRKARKHDNKQYLADVDKKIQQQQLDYEEKNRGGKGLSSIKDQRLRSISQQSENKIKQIESNAKRALSTLKSKHKQHHKRKKTILGEPFQTKKNDLNQKFQERRTKTLSLFSSEIQKISSAENKEINAINREIDVDSKAKIQVALDSFKKAEAAKKAEKAKKIKLEEPKESSGFFESLF